MARLWRVNFIPACLLTSPEMEGGKLTTVGTAGEHVAGLHGSNLIGLKVSFNLGVFDLFTISRLRLPVWMLISTFGWICPASRCLTLMHWALALTLKKTSSLNCRHCWAGICRSFQLPTPQGVD
jgi:hypothetical protein